MSYPMKHSKLDIPALKECLARRKKLSLWSKAPINYWLGLLNKIKLIAFLWY
jgi:hypothetical protein